MLRQRTFNQMYRSGWYMMERHSSSSMAAVEVRRRVSQEDVDQFAAITGDSNFLHSHQCPIEHRCIHGALLNGLVAGIIGTKLPGPGTVVIAQSFSFPNKCVVDEDIDITVKLVEDRKIKRIQYECKQIGKTVFIGSADLYIRNVKLTSPFDLR